MSSDAEWKRVRGGLYRRTIHGRIYVVEQGRETRCWYWADTTSARTGGQTAALAAGKAEAESRAEADAVKRWESAS